MSWDYGADPELHIHGGSATKHYSREILNFVTLPIGVIYGVTEFQGRRGHNEV